MKKTILSILLACLLLASVFLVLPSKTSAAYLPTTGWCGNNLTYALGSNGVLTISGTGPMWDDPWEEAFDECIEQVVIQYGATSIGCSAFSGCTELRNVTIPASVTVIGDGAFSGCNGLTSVTIPASVTAIGHYAFSHTSLTSINIPYGVTVIGDGAFSECYGLTYISIPSSVTTIGSYAFYGCIKLNNVSIPYGVTTIGDSAFNHTGLTSVSIPASVSSICTNAFGSCESLNGIWVNANNPYYSNDSNGVLFNKNKTALCQVPAKKSGSYQIPSSVTRITDYAFSYCTGLTSITIPDSVTSIGDSAFLYCTGLTTVNFNAPHCTSMGSENNPVFAGCTGPATMNIGDNVTAVPSYAFQDFTGLTSIIIPNNVTSLGNSAFDGCTGLTSITIPDSVTSIGDHAFYKCTNLATVNIGDNITVIPDCAFSYCSGLASIDIPDNVTSIGYAAFGSCTGLTSITIPDSVTSIGGYAFKGCTGVTTLNFNATKCTTMGSWRTIFGEDYFCPVFEECTNLTTVNIGGNVTSIPSDAFYGCSGLTSISIPDSVTSIGGSAFYGCSGLTSVTIPDSVTGIGGSAFYGCSGLTSVTIPESVTSIGDYAFEGCTGVTTLNFNATTGDSNWSSNFTSCTNLTTLNIGDKVTTIPGSAFRSCLKLSTVTIGNSVTSIGDSAFDGCTGLTSITIPNSVTSIGKYAFRNCSGLTTVNFNATKCTTMGSWYNGIFDDYYPVFQGCTNVTTLNIGDNVTSIPSIAFYGFSGLTTVTIPDSVTSIGYAVFGIYPNLTEVNFNATNCTNMGDKYYPAFKFCTDVTTLNIGDNVTSIPAYAFYGCSGLTSITIPESVTSIGDYAFYECDALQTVFYKGTETQKKDSLSIGDSNSSLSNTAWHYEVEAKSMEGLSVLLCKECGLLYNLDGSKVPLQQLDFIPDAAQTRYFVGEAVTVEKLSLVGTYSDGTQVTIGVKGVDSISADTSTPGRKSASVTAAGMTSDLEIYVHDFDISSATIIDIDPSLYPQSSHNYSNNLNETKTFTYPDAQALIITFHWKTNVETNYDYIYVFDGAGNQLAKYTGVVYTNTTLTIPGDTFKIKLTSNSSNNYYGYAFSSIQAKVNSESIHPPVVTEPIAATCTQAGLTAGSHCEICGDILVSQEATPALGHSYQASFTWSEYHTSCAATIACNRGCGFSQAVDCAIAHNEANQSQVVHTAVAEYNGEQFTDTVTCNVSQVTFRDWDGTLISQAYYHAGEAVAIPADPTRTPDQEYRYTFAGWDNEVVPCAGDATYTATYASALIDYTVVFQNWNGAVLSSQTCHYGDTVIIPDDPSRAPDNTYTYTFAGWDNKIVACEGNTTYTATYTTSYIDYTVTFQYSDGTLIQTSTLHYGDPVVAPADPSVPDALGENYKFRCWDKEITTCQGNAIYTALFVHKYAGDLTGDGKVNSLDGLLLLRYLNGWEVNIAAPQAMDVNGDGKVNSLDGLILMRYLNGWDITLG